MAIGIQIPLTASQRNCYSAPLEVGDPLTISHYHALEAYILAL